MPRGASWKPRALKDRRGATGGSDGEGARWHSAHRTDPRGAASASALQHVLDELADLVDLLRALEADDEGVHAAQAQDVLQRRAPLLGRPERPLAQDLHAQHAG